MECRHCGCEVPIKYGKNTRKYCYDQDCIEAEDMRRKEYANDKYKKNMKRYRKKYEQGRAKRLADKPKCQTCGKPMAHNRFNCPECLRRVEGDINLEMCLFLA